MTPIHYHMSYAVLVYRDVLTCLLLHSHWVSSPQLLYQFTLFASPNIHSFRFVLFNPLSSIHCSRFTVAIDCSQFTVAIHCFRFTTFDSLFSIHCSQFTVLNSLFSIHCSQFTVLNSLFSIHCFDSPLSLNFHSSTLIA
jgi:hypothetical protein